MNLKTYRPKRSTEGSLFFITQNTGSLIQRSPTKSQEISEDKLNKLRESFSFDKHLQQKEDERMIGLTSTIFLIQQKQKLCFNLLILFRTTRNV